MGNWAWGVSSLSSLTFAFGAWLLWRSERKQFQKGALLEGEVVDFYDCYVVKNVEVEIAKALL